MILKPEAEADILDAFLWYESQGKGLGQRFEDAVGQVFEQLEAFPESHAVVHRDVRRALVRTFPFAVYYRLEGDEVVVLAVVHARRDPQRWKSRI